MTRDFQGDNFFVRQGFARGKLMVTLLFAVIMV